MPRSRLNSRPPDSPTDVFLTIDELAARWKRAPLTVGRLARQFGIPVYRLTTKGHLYALRDIEAVEEKAKNKVTCTVPYTAYKMKEEQTK
jgi:hypothetical protein